MIVSPVASQRRRVCAGYYSIFLLVSSAAWANEAENLHGNWTLVSFFTEDVQTKQRVNAYGEKPTGAIGFTPAGRFGFVTAEGRKAPQTPEEQAAAYRTMIAYTGKWRVEGDKFITKVDVAWNRHGSAPIRLASGA